jgi:hypothetical protein
MNEVNIPKRAKGFPRKDSPYPSMSFRMRSAAIVCLLLLGLLAQPVHACSCAGVEKGGEECWVKAVSDFAHTIVVARVSGVSGELKSAGKLNVSQTIKGKSQHTILVTTGVCQDFELRYGEVRVFFLTEKNEVSGCSNYKPQLSNDTVVSILKRFGTDKQ